MNLQASTRASKSREHAAISGPRSAEATRRAVETQAQQANSENTNCQSKGFFDGQTSQHTRTLLAEIQRVAQRPFNILITGETGTGKTHVGREVHRRSARSNKPLMELNCANLSEHLVEAELFGYSKGAFTGADHHHKGLFEEADGGILFLDELGDVPPTVQSKLLRVIDEKQIKRLGTNQYRYCDVQIIAATSRNLIKMIEAGQFREDLYCRLAMLTIETAPLRERREDIPALITFYLREVAEAIAKVDRDSEPYRIDDRALALLCQCDYPGNIRSLRNLVYELTSYVNEREVISVELVQFALAKLNIRTDSGANESNCGRRKADSTIDVRFEAELAASSFIESMAKQGDIILPLEVCVLRQGETFKQWTARAKRCSIEAARHATGGSLQEVAQRLGLTRSSLRGHLRRAKRTLTESMLNKPPNCDSPDH